MVDFSNKNSAKSIFIANVKGGVGKSTLSIMLARAMASNLPPQNITVIDIDLQRTTTEFLSASNLKLILSLCQLLLLLKYKYCASSTIHKTK